MVVTGEATAADMAADGIATKLELLGQIFYARVGNGSRVFRSVRSWFNPGVTRV
jgi:hypothetical protein